MDKSKLYPLTSAQKLLLLSLRYCPEQVLNIGISLTILDDIDFEVLKNAIYKAYERCESMRLRFKQGDDNTVYQYIYPKEEREIEHFDFSSWKPEDIQVELKNWTSIPFKKYDSPMNRIATITMPDGYKGIYMNVNHLTMDSFAIIIFMKDIIELYCNMKYDIPYPKALASYEAALIKDLEYENNSKALRNDEEYFNKALKESEPIFTDILGTERLNKEREKTGNPNLRAASIASTSVEANIKYFHLEEEPSRRLIDFCTQNRIPFVCLLMMGLRTYLSKINEKETDISVKTTVARRGTLLEKKSGGSRIHFFPCRTVIGMTETFLEGIRKIQDVQNSIFKHANYDSLKILSDRSKYYNVPPNQGYECMSLTYQPLTMKSKVSDIGDIKYKAEWYSNGVAASPLYLTVMHRSLDDGLDFCFEYQNGVINENQLEYIYYYLCRIIFRGIEDPNRTVEQIIDMV